MVALRVPASNDVAQLPMDGLANFRINKDKADQDKGCSFLCGRKQCDIDEVNSDELLKWGYSDGSGGACYYCERTWRCRVKHTVPGRDRVAFCASMSKDQKIHAGFHQKRNDYLTKLKRKPTTKVAGQLCSNGVTSRFAHNVGHSCMHWQSQSTLPAPLYVVAQCTHRRIALLHL